MELLNYRKDGTQFWNRLAIAPARNEAGITTHFIGIQSDITKRKKAEDALFHANQQLRVTNERMTRELAVAAQAQQSLLSSKPVGCKWRGKSAAPKFNIYPALIFGNSSFENSLNTPSIIKVL